MTRPQGVEGLILAGPALSIPRWIQDANHLVDALDDATRKTIRDAESSGRTDSKEYEAAMGVFYGRHLCRLDPWPQGLQDAMAGMNHDIYVQMNGPSEFTLTGTLKDYDITPRLGSIQAPTLLICGEFDEAQPDTTRYYASLIPGAECTVVAGAAHIANFDQPWPYLGALRDWMARHRL
jgi:proline iminopeptidase